MKAVFIDRDGTIGGSGGGVHPFEFSMFEFTPRSIRLLNELGVKVFLFTNQTRVGRGFFTEADLVKGFEIMKEELSQHSAMIDDIFYCPHKPDDGCICQKPKIGLLLAAKEKYKLNLKDCYVVGDTGSSDMVSADQAGTKKVLVKTGWGEGSLTSYREGWKEIEPDFVAKDLWDAVQWISADIERLS